MRRNLRKILIILIAFILIYLNSAITINSIAMTITPYLNRMNNGQTDATNNTDNTETKNEADIIEINRDVICKTDAVDNMLEFKENVKLNIDAHEEILQARVRDAENLFMSGEVFQNTTNQCKKIIIQQEELLQILGDTGYLIIMGLYGGITQFMRVRIDKDVIERIALNENGEIITNTAGDDEIAIICVKEGTVQIEFNIRENNHNREQIWYNFSNIPASENNKELNLEITQIIFFSTMEILENATRIETIWDYIETKPQMGKTIPYIVYTELKDRQTKAELGINTEELSTTIENNAQFTITLSTEKTLYDLFKNPSFIIELPEEIETINEINKDNITIINNKRVNELGVEEDIFTNLVVEQQESNNKKYIILNMEGEQTEYTDENIDNLQIIIPAKIQISKLTPTKEAIVNLYYSNENKTTYNQESQNLENYGEFNKTINIVGRAGMLTETKINIDDQSITSYKGEALSLIIPSKENNQGVVNVSIVNNQGMDLTNAYILGHAENFGPINIQNKTVKYSTIENATKDSAGWQEEYVEGAKSYLIELDTFNQGEKIDFGYNINIPKVNEDRAFVEEYQIITANNTVLDRERNFVEVKSANLDVKLEPSVGQNAVYAGQEFNYNITIKNNGGAQAEEINIVNTLPEGVSLVNEEDSISWEGLTLNAGETITKRITVKVNEDVEEGTNLVATTEVSAKYLENNIIKTAENQVKQSKIEYQLFPMIEQGSMPIQNVVIDSYLEYGIQLTNKDQEQKDITVIVEFPENIDNEAIFGTMSIEDTQNGGYISQETGTINGNNITITIPLEPGEDRFIRTSAIVDKYISREVKTIIKIRYDNEEIILEDVQNAITPAEITVSSKAYKNNIEITEEEIELTEEDELKYEIKIKNTGETVEHIEIDGKLDLALEPTSIKFTSTNENNNMEYDEEKLGIDFGMSLISLKQNDEGTLEVVAKLRKPLTETTEIENMFKIKGNSMEEETIAIKHKVLVDGTNPDDPNNPDDPSNPDDPNNPDNPNDPTNPDDPNNPNDPITEKKYTVSGVAWLDVNKNGARETEESVLGGIKVKLIKDNTTKQETTTTKQGAYSFKDVEKGEYVIVFEYDTNEYELTAYQKEGVLNTLNSDALEVNGDGVNLVRTDKLVVDKDLANIDIGLIKRGIFDLKISKGLSKITVQNNEGTKVVNYNNESLAKIEIPAKSYLGTDLIIEYNIVVENIGEVPGYAYGIVDIMPQGTIFSSELNPDWYEENGYLYSVSLMQDIIKPGEKKILKVVLIKEINEDKAIDLINKSEIIETFNEELLQEKDLQNNISQAELIIAIKTGKAITYIILTIIVLTIVVVGAYTIKKKVL